MEAIETNKSDIENWIGQINEQTSKVFWEVDTQALEEVRTGLFRIGFDIEDFKTLELKRELTDVIKDLIAELETASEAMKEEARDVCDRLRELCDSYPSNEGKGASWKKMRASKDRAVDLAKQAKVKDDSLKESFEKVERIIWREEAAEGLNSLGSDLSDILDRAPKTCVSTELYEQLNKKISADEKDVNGIEKEVHEVLSNYFNEEETLAKRGDDLNRYIQKMKKRNFGEKIDRLLTVGENVLSLLRDSDFDDCEGVVEALFECKFYGTKIFESIELLQKTVEKIRRDTHLFISSLSRPKKSTEKGKSKSSLASMRELERPELSRAKELIQSIEELPQGPRSSFKEFENSLNEKIDAIESFKSKVREAQAKFSKVKISSLKLDSLVSDFEKLLKEYCSLDFSCQEVQSDIEKIGWILKGLHLLEGKTYDSIPRTLDGWKKTIDALQDEGGYILTSLEKKYQAGKVFRDEVEKVKAAQSGPRGDKDKLPNLAEADHLLKEAAKSCKEIELTSERAVLENAINSVQGKLKILESDEIVMLHDLQACLDVCKRAPLNLKEEIGAHLEEERRANEFLQRVRELPPELFRKKQEELEEIGRGLKVKVLEWEDMKSAVHDEEQSIERIESILSSETADLSIAEEVREKYRNIKYLRDLGLETRIMLMFLQSLRSEYERRQDQFVREETAKPAVDFLTLSGLLRELEELAYRVKSGEASVKAELIGLQEGQRFIQDLFSDAKKHLEYHVYTLTLEQLNSQNVKKIFKKFVDLTGCLLDYKIDLEMQERKRQQAQRPVTFPTRDSGKRGGVFESRLSRDRDSEEMVPGHMTSFSNPLGVYSGGADRETGRVGDQLFSNGRPIHHPFRDEPETAPIKPPVSKSIVTEELREYYSKIWKKLMEANTYLDLSGLDALMASKSLEKGVFDKIKNSPLEYDVLCTSITGAFKHVEIVYLDFTIQKHFQAPEKRGFQATGVTSLL